MLRIIPLSSLAKVFSDEEPKAKPFNKLSMFRNERASVQIAMQSDSDCEVFAEIKSKISDSVTLYEVEEIYSSLAVGKTQDDYTLRRGAGYFPELLRPTDGRIKLGAGKWKSLWLEVYSKDQLPVGEQKVEVALKTQSGEEKAEFVFDVIDMLLPEQSLIYTNWFHTDCIATYYGLEVFSEDYWRYVEKYLEVAREYGMNMVLTPLFTPPLDTKVGKERLTVQLIGVEYSDSGYSFDFSKLDRWIDTCERVGIKYYEMSHLFTQWGAKKCPKIVAKVNGKEERIFGWKTRASGKKYSAFLSALAPKLKEFLINKGIADRVYFHVSDEPSKSMLRSYRKASKIVKELFGDFKMIDALSSYDFYEKGLVELPIPATNHIKPFIGNVPELWTYYCSAQSDGVANRFFSMPSQRNRVLGYQLYKFDVKGFLHWGYNFWYKRLSVGEVDPYKETDAGGFFPSGDSYVVYPGKDGEPLLSLRLKVFFDGLQDMRALQLAESLAGRERTLEVLEKDIQPIAFDKYPHSDEWQLGCRERINDFCKAESKKQK
ncbi:MAG: DUF4091 domain-containing protein [Clostridia bacterium]|nr:DUF4091 domain-containing protein [Clostridia bacterium]